ncbi:hypothetical protein WR25_23840 [Diploscapter pachys]|uniref:Uncharacterized protein n=1 Tax=Diploscapter pachys TaxID=2018661 RepID=A0A2A2J8J6_9BILA|nr:hypothetical protein WR25_23840 [Diploscapter pachys]
MFDWGHTKCFFPTSFIRHYKYASAIACLYPAAYAMSMVLIAMHFIYRFFTLCKPIAEAFQVNVDEIHLMTLKYFTETPTGFVPRWKDLGVCVDMLFLVAIVVYIIFYFCYKIHITLKENVQMISEKTKRLQIQLFKALFCQVI